MLKEIDFKDIEFAIENHKFSILNGKFDALNILFENIIEKNIFLRGAKKENYEILSYLKLKNNKPLEAFYYGFESFKDSKNSFGIVIAAIALFRLRQHDVGSRFMEKYKFDIVSMLNSNKFSEKAFEEINEFKTFKLCLERILTNTKPIKEKDFSFIKNTGYYEFLDEKIKIKSYRSNGMINVHLLECNGEYLILDCGAEITNNTLIKADLENFLYDIPKDKIKGAIISHAHLDHYGSLDILYDYTDNIYMSNTTLDIIRLADRYDILDLSKLKLYKDYKEFTIESFIINPIPNGHIMGSSAFMISSNNFNLFYSGDFCFSNQNTLSGLKKRDIEYLIKEKGAIDYLLTESTYGHKEEWLTYAQRKDILKLMVEKSYSNGVKVFIPSFAIGRAQECHSIINESDSMQVLVDGLATKITRYYNKNSINSNLITTKTTIDTDMSIEEKYNLFPIIIASSGMLQDGSTSMKYYKHILKDKMTTVIKCGYMDKATTDDKLKAFDGLNINLIEINLSAHGQYDEIIELIQITKPTNLIMVHGEGIDKLNDKITNFNLI